MKIALALIALSVLAACAAPGPTYRGDPPPGYTHAEYERKLTGKTDPIRAFEMRDRSPTNEADATPEAADGE